MRKQLKITCWI